jgi:hypothetical protein
MCCTLAVFELFGGRTTSIHQVQQYDIIPSLDVGGSQEAPPTRIQTQTPSGLNSGLVTSHVATENSYWYPL